MSPGGSSKDGRQPGTLQGDRLTPSVPATHTATRFMEEKHLRDFSTEVQELKNRLTDPLQHLGHLGNNLVQWAAFFCQGSCQLTESENKNRQTNSVYSGLWELTNQRRLVIQGRGLKRQALKCSGQVKGEQRCCSMRNIVCFLNIKVWKHL